MKIFSKISKPIYPLFSGEKAYIADYDTQNDCGCSMNVYFKHLENSADEGVILYVHIPKVMEHKIEVELMLMKSNGLPFGTHSFCIDLQSEKSKKCKGLGDLFDAMDDYYREMQQIINEQYLPPA